MHWHTENVPKSLAQKMPNFLQDKILKTQKLPEVYTISNLFPLYKQV